MRLIWEWCSGLAAGGAVSWVKVDEEGIYRVVMNGIITRGLSDMVYQDEQTMETGLQTTGMYHQIGDGPRLYF